ncbi:MAG TPA: HhH-GPD-type base excision DNA repair protein [Gaiellaceae bacterium]|nr:HhH-GPD-type base excision DNA repair protein [Gaiellaceae bacterium]
MAATRPTHLHFTGDDEADRLLADEPLALLIGFVLDQQVLVQKAFSGPLELRRRLGILDATAIAALDPARLEEAFREKPALHRYPGAMSRRVQDLCATIAEEYGGRAERVWLEAESGEELERRLLALPGIGPMKARSLLAILGKRFGVRPTGWNHVAPSHPTLGDVDSPEALEAYQAWKRDYKASQRSARAT